MKKLLLPVLVSSYSFICPAKAQNICTQQFSSIAVQGNATGITTADAQGIVADILDVMGSKGNFEIKAANISNAAAVAYNGKRYLLYNPVFISRLNEVTGNDWASVSVLAHEIGHHLNGHTLSGGSEPARELEADEFSGYIMHRLGATLEEAETAMKLAADVKGTATHPGRTDRLVAIEQGWNRASDQLAADIEANENDSTPAIPLKKVPSTDTSTGDAAGSTVKSNMVGLAKEHILAQVFFEEDKTGQYYLTVDGRLVAVKNNRLFRLGQLKENNNSKYPYILENKEARLYIDTSGIIINEYGEITGRIKI